MSRKQISNLIETWPHRSQHFCLTDHDQRKMKPYQVSHSMFIVWVCVLPIIACVAIRLFPLLIQAIFGLFIPLFLYQFLISYSLTFVLHFIFQFVFFLKPYLQPLSCCRHLTSVSWDRQRRQMSTVCSADRWEQCTCLERLSALLRSWPSISWVRGTRWALTLRWLCDRYLLHYIAFS